MSYYYYPGYNYDFRSLKTDDGIEVVDMWDKLMIKFGEASDIVDVLLPGGKRLTVVDRYKGSRTPRMLYRDANGDGVKDVIVRMNSFYSGMMEQIDNNCYCVIVDGKTHKASELSAKDYFKKFDDVTSVTGKRVSDDNLEIRVSLSGGEEVIDNIEINENTEIGDIRLNSENQYIYFGEDGPYVGFWVTAYAQYTDTYRELISLLVKNKLVSAPGKRFDGDTKVTDLLYLCKTHIEHNLPYEQLYQVVCDRYKVTEVNLEVQVNIQKYLRRRFRRY